MKKYILLFLIIQSFLLNMNKNTWAQNPEWIVYNTSNSGLPSNSVRSIAIDGTGNKWIGTAGADSGLAKFDGTNWAIYNLELCANAITSLDLITSLAIDISENIWIGVGYFGGDMFYGCLMNFDKDTTWTIYNVANSQFTVDYVTLIDIDGFNNK